MKIANYLPVAISAIAINSGGFALAETSPLLQHNLTITLTELSAGDYTESSKGESIKPIKSKISNKEILEFLVEQGEIESISGWSIVGYTQDGNYEGFYLFNKNGSIIDASNWFNLDSDSGWDYYVYTYSETTTTKGDVETQKGTESYTDYEGLFSFYYEDDDQNEIIELELRGPINWLDEYIEAYDSDLEETVTSIYNITELSVKDGSGFIEDEDEFYGVVTGSAVLGKGKAIVPEL